MILNVCFSESCGIVLRVSSWVGLLIHIQEVPMFRLVCQFFTIRDNCNMWYTEIISLKRLLTALSGNRMIFLSFPFFNPIPRLTHFLPNILSYISRFFVMRGVNECSTFVIFFKICLSIREIFCLACDLLLLFVCMDWPFYLFVSISIKSLIVVNVIVWVDVTGMEGGGC